MTTLSTRLSLLLPDDGGPGGDDTVNVTTQISDNFAKLDSAVGILDSATAPITNLFVGKIWRNSTTGEVWRYTGAVWEFLFDTKHTTTWLPTITSAGGSWVYGTGGDKVCKYIRFGDRIWVDGWIYTGGAGFSGGQGVFSITVPFKAKNVTAAISWGPAVLSARGEDCSGFARLDPNGTTLKLSADYLDTAAAPNRIRTYYAQNSDSGGTIGTGIPRFAGAYTWDASNAGYLNWQISYQYDITVPVASA